MKRLAVFCDGTWNKLSAPEPTNVVLAARALRSEDDAGIQQFTHYHEGVGTSFTVNEEWETRLAGAFGLGLFEKIAEAYRFLVFNYVPGDQIYIFGFSRGAFTARSLSGLIRKCGILRKDRLERIGEAFILYKDHAVAPSDPAAIAFRKAHSHEAAMTDAERIKRGNGRPSAAPPFSISYLGVWDTVGALGIPSYITDVSVHKYRFHDGNLSSMVGAARHAVAIDEQRKAFDVTLWDNVDELNAERPGNYEQRWFPGDHGSVGGGGKVRGLSNSALLWVVEGAQRQGLAFDSTVLKQYRAACDFESALHNSGEPANLIDSVKDFFLFPTAPRPSAASARWDQLSNSAQNRLTKETKSRQAPPPYRPDALTGIVTDLTAGKLPGREFKPWKEF